MPAAKKIAAAGPADKGLKVVARREGGFRRCGRLFPFEGITVPLSELTDDEVATLRAEPQLVVVDVDIAEDA